MPSDEPVTRTKSHLRERLQFFALPWALVAAVYYPLRFGWTRDAAEHVAWWAGCGFVFSVAFGAYQDWTERQAR